MNVLKNRALTLATALAMAAAGCSGDKGPAGPAGSNGSNGAVITGGLSVGGLKIVVKGVTVNADQSVSVEFTAADDNGGPVDLAGKYSTNAAMAPRFSLSKINVAADGKTMLPYSVLTKTGSAAFTTTEPDPSTVKLNPTAAAPLTPAVPATSGVLTENGSGAGDYTYTFATCPTSLCSSDAPGTGSNTGKTVRSFAIPVKVDPKSTDAYALWIEAARQTNTANTDDAKGFKAVNVEFDFVPSNPTATIVKRQVAATTGCSNCHNAFKPESSVKSAFHGGTRVEAAYCDVCHNVERKSTATNSDVTTPAANASIFVHRIHAGKELQAANVFHGINEVTYPQDLRNCDACHKGATQGAQAKTVANRAVCGSCHDYVVFDAAKVGSLTACINQADPTKTAKDATTGAWSPCVHSGAVNTDDTTCKGCHVEGGSGFIGDKHVAVALPNPTNSLLPLPAGDPTNTHTNQMYVAAAGALPAGAIQLKYVVSQVAAVTDNSVTPSVLRPQITFKFQQSTDGTNFTDVVFNTYAPAATPPVTEMMDNFVGSPSVYFAFSVPQDGITAPADFNATASAYIKNVWNGTVLPAVATMTGPVNGLYTITLTGSIIPANAAMLTGGVGYTYGTSSTQPMTQTNVPGYPYNWDPYSNTTVAGVGGLLVPVHDEWIVGTGYTGRRSIVDNARCRNCHGFLGVNPTFHAGQRNDGPTCSFCHNANQNNSGWSGNTKDFIHGLHAGLQAGTYTLPDGAVVSGGSGVRTVPFGWHALSDTEGYWDVTFPGQHNYCNACHADGLNSSGKPDGTFTYDFSNAISVAALPNMLSSTEATGTAAIPVAFGSSPYVSNTTIYGAGFKYTASTGVITPAAATTLVTSPITAACVACHDSSSARGHMMSNGGSFYSTRANAAGKLEGCLVCHGPDGLWPIATVHK